MLPNSCHGNSVNQPEILDSQSYPHPRYYPKCYGLIERYVQIIKKTHIKCRETREDPYFALLSLRTTIKADIKSLAELLAARKYKTNLSSKINLALDQGQAINKLADTQRPLRGQHVHIQDPEIKICGPAKIIDKAETPRFYVIISESVKQLVRNNPHSFNSRTDKTKNHTLAHICGRANTNERSSYDKRDHLIQSANKHHHKSVYRQKHLQ